jgi:predicted RNA-binding protein YlxR (DUF448 family)
MCVACRQSQDKKSLVRIVRTIEGVFVDPTGKISGRGAYLHEDPACWSLGSTKKLEKALKTTFTKEDLARMEEYQKSIKNRTREK